MNGAICGELEAATGCWGSPVVASLVDPVTAMGTALSGAVCRELEAATGCWGSSVVASLVDAVTVVGLALTGAVGGELDGDTVTCRLSGALVAGETGETIVESKVPGLRGTAAMTDLPSHRDHEGAIETGFPQTHGTMRRWSCPARVLELRSGTRRRSAVSASLPGQKVTCNAPPDPPPPRPALVSVDPRRDGASAERSSCAPPGGV